MNGKSSGEPIFWLFPAEQMYICTIYGFVEPKKLEKKYLFRSSWNQNWISMKNLSVTKTLLPKLCTATQMLLLKAGL